MEDTLKICTKRRYESQEEALKMVNYLEVSGKAPDGELRFYDCRICHFYHLTSKVK